MAQESENNISDILAALYFAHRKNFKNTTALTGDLYQVGNVYGIGTLYSLGLYIDRLHNIEFDQKDIKKLMKYNMLGYDGIYLLNDRKFALVYTKEPRGISLDGINYVARYKTGDTLLDGEKLEGLFEHTCSGTLWREGPTVTDFIVSNNTDGGLYKTDRTKYINLENSDSASIDGIFADNAEIKLQNCDGITLFIKDSENVRLTSVETNVEVFVINSSVILNMTHGNVTINIDDNSSVLVEKALIEIPYDIWHDNRLVIFNGENKIAESESSYEGLVGQHRK